MKTLRNALIFLSFFLVKVTFGQPPIRIFSGKVSINDGRLGFIPARYTTTIDSLDKILKVYPNDTTTLFYRALLYSLSNNLMARPYQRENGALENLLIGKTQVEKSIYLGMSGFKIRVLRAQLYSDITYRYTGDESWMFNKKQIAERKAQFNRYKDLTNKYYDELAQEDRNNAWDYQRLKVKSEYPIR
jgi:hypothetical protein